VRPRTDPPIYAPVPAGWLAVQGAPIRSIWRAPISCRPRCPSPTPALTELRILAGEERDDWPGQQRAFMSGYRRGQRRGQARAAPARRRRPGAAPPLAISLPGAARRKH